MPIHIALPADGDPYADCSAKVNHKNAPGAISAMALMVRPVNPKVGLVVGLFPPPGGVGSFVIFVGEFCCFWFAVCLFGFHVADHIAWLPVSSVRMRTACSMEVTKIFPSPIFPVLALWTTAAMALSARSSGTTSSILILGRQSMVYSLPRKISVWPFCR